MKALSYFNFILAAAFVVFFCYQAVYAVVRLLGKGRKFKEQKLCRYAVLIAARNEQAVIGQLLDSIHRQDYPADLVDVYVVADNCTDDTARIAAANGAVVYQRQNREMVGKGYALQFLLEKIRSDQELPRYDGYFVFDADNLLDSHYITEMNKVFSNGNWIVTGYRNTKNFGDNWITAGYGLYFLRESEFLNRPRDYLGVSCTVSGTGYLFADSLLDSLGGWHYHLLTEDLEFTAHMISRGERIAYCGDAVLYDEQPRSFRQSITQRSRWIRGFFQVIAKSGGDLLRTLASTGRFACYDMLMSNLVTAVLVVLSFLVNAATGIAGMVTARQELGTYFTSVALSLLNSYAVLYGVGLMALLTEWKQIRCSAGKKLLYSFTFPLFIYSFALAMLAAFFGNVQWKPIRHTVAVSIDDLNLRR